MTKVILSNQLSQRLIEAGIMPPKCRRAVIDLQAGHPPMLYFECLGDEALLDVLIPETLLEVKTGAA